MDIELKLPPEEKDEFGYTPSETKIIEKKMATMGDPKSNGAFARLVESNKLAEKETPAQTWSRLDGQEKQRQKDHLKKLITHNVEQSSVSVSTAKPGSKQHKADVMDYINKKVDMYEGGGVKIDPPVLRDNINNKRYVNKSLNKFENRTDNPNTVTFNPTTQLFTNKDRTIAFKDYNSADNHNKSLGAKPKYPTEASPEQFGQLAERLERDRQMRGAPTNLKEFGHRFNENKKGPQYPGMKPWEEKKKIPTPREPVKIDLASYTPFIPLGIPKPSPEHIRAEKNFNQTLENNRLEKEKNATTGIAGLVGGDPKYYG